MKAKRRVCAFLFSALMIWQGFMIVNAEGALDAGKNGDAEVRTENDTPGSGATDGSNTTTQEGKGNGSGTNVPGASGSGLPAQQGSVTQTGSGSQTATGSVVTSGAATSPAETGETTAPVKPSTAEETTASENSLAAGEPVASASLLTAGQPTASESLAAAETAAVAGAVRSQHQPTLVNDVIRNAEIYLDGNDPKKLEGQLINQTTVLRLRADLKVGGKKLYEGDYAEIVLPQELKSYSKEFDIKGTGDEVVAKGKYDEGTNTIRITFTDKIETFNKADGEFFFKMQMNKDKATETKQYDLDIKVGGDTLNRKVNYNAEFVESPKTFFKDTVLTDSKVIQQITVDGKVHYLVRYQVTFDAAHFGNPGKDYKNVVFTDTLGSPALSYFDPANQHPALSVANARQYQPELQKGVWRRIKYQNGKTLVAPDDTDENGYPYWSLRKKDDNSKNAEQKKILRTSKEPEQGKPPQIYYYEENGVKKFKINLGDIDKNEGVVLMYYVEIVGEIPVYGVSYTNNASLKSDGGDLNTPKQEKTFTISDAGGFIKEKPFIIRVHKTGENGASLQGAIFKLKTDGSDRNLITDENGMAEIKNAIKDDYELVEIEAPEGYQTNSTPISIKKDDFDRAVKDGDSVINITVINKKTPNPPPTPNNPPTPGNPPATPPTPGQVLGARRYPEGQGGQEQEKPAVLGTRRGRGSADTSDHSASDIHWLLFGFGTAGLFAICINELVGLEKLLHRRKSRR